MLSHYYRDHHPAASFLKHSHYPSQYYPDLSPLEMCYLLQGDGRGENERFGKDEASHFVNTALTIRDVQLLLLQGKMIYHKI